MPALISRFSQSESVICMTRSDKIAADRLASTMCTQSMHHLTEQRANGTKICSLPQEKTLDLWYCISKENWHCIFQKMGHRSRSVSCYTVASPIVHVVSFGDWRLHAASMNTLEKHANPQTIWTNGMQPINFACVWWQVLGKWLKSIRHIWPGAFTMLLPRCSHEEKSKPRIGIWWSADIIFSLPYLPLRDTWANDLACLVIPLN